MRILIVDDHEVVRRGVRSLLANREGIEVCGEAVDGRDAIAKAHALQPDVITMDISMPNLNGLEATREIRRQMPDVQILMLSHHDVPGMMQQALNAGANGYVVKSAVSTDLVEALDKIRRGESSFCNAVFGSAQSHVDTQEVLQRSAAFEKAWRESEGHLRLALEASNTALFEWDIASARGQWNPQMAAIYGFTPEGNEMTAEGWMRLFHPEDAPRLLKEAEETFRKKSDFQFEFRVAKPDGSMRWILSKGRVVRDADGKAMRLIGTHTDITERKVAEEAVHKAVRQQRALFELADRLHRAQSLEDIYSAAFEAIFSALQCDRASILLYDAANVMRFVSWRGLSDAYRKTTEGHSPWKPEVVNPTPICMNDVATAELSDALKGVVLGEGIRALAFIPLVSQGKLIGKFMVYYNTPHAFSAEETEIALTIARQVAFGIGRIAAERASVENARLLDLTYDAILVRDACDRITFWNEGATEMYGYTREQALGRVSHELFRTEFAEPLEAIKEKLLRDHGWMGELTHTTARGTKITVSSHWLLDVDGQGNVTSILESNRDITQRKRAEQAQYRLAAIVESSDDAIVSKDLNGIITSWNAGAQRIFGFTPEEAIGRSVTIIIPAELHEQEKEILARLRAGERIEHFETIRQRKDGKRLHVWLTISPVRDSSGRIIGASKIARDVTERKQIENALKEAEMSGRLLQLQDEEKRRMARELHDGVGQLLAGLSMNVAGVLREKEKLSAEAARAVEENQELVQQAITEIRTLSHLLHPPLLEELGFASALSDYVDGFGKRSNIRVTVDLPTILERLPREHELCLFRIVQECLTNVHRHSGSATARVRVSRTAEEIQLEVSDEGRGIGQEIQESFIAGKSAGVGLRGMRERVRQLGGTLHIQPRRKGASILAALPLRSKATPERESDASEPHRRVKPPAHERHAKTPGGAAASDAKGVSGKKLAAPRSSV